MPEECDFPVYGTQGGGLVRRSGDHYVFVEVPDWGNFKVGDKMPGDWGIAAANEKARNEIEDEFPDDFDVMGDNDSDGADDGGESRFPDAGSHWTTIGRDG
jgi:hypothetical protein